MRCRRPGQACQPSQAQMATKVNITDQISPKAASGGFQAGCFKAKYQASSTVKDPPIPATPKLSTKDNSRLRQCVLSVGDTVI